MKNSLKALLVVVVLVVIGMFSLVGSYNKMVSLDQKVKSSKANIEITLQRRNDLIPNLVSTVKGYASQEKEIFKDIADARSKLNNAKSINDRANADSELSSALSRLLVVVERYPDLKSNQNFRDLTVALESSENRISIARQDYNSIVDKYNTNIKRFPNSIIANVFGFTEKEYYKATEGAKEVPKVDFTK